MLRAVIQMLPKRFMDVRMRVAGGYETRIVERPGLWMDAEALENLTADLRLVAAHTLNASELTYGVFAADPDRMQQSIISVVYRSCDKRPIAFNALALMDLKLGQKPVQVLHLGLVMIDPGERSKGLSWVLYGLTCVLMLLRNQLRPLWISNVTQVPAVTGMVAETFSGVFPGPHAGARRSLTHQLLARQIMAEHRHVFGVGPEADFDEERFVITNAYTGGSDGLKKSFADAAKYRDPIYNTFCARELDYDRGDDVMQIGRVDVQAARNYLTEQVPRGSLAALSVAGAVAVLQRLALPLWHWIDTSREWNDLRPWKAS